MFVPVSYNCSCQMASSLRKLKVKENTLYAGKKIPESKRAS